jgi:hypothetical protein
LDCWSGQDRLRAPMQRPPAVPVAAPRARAAPPTEGTRDSYPELVADRPFRTPHTAARPIFYDHDHEVRARNSRQLLSSAVGPLPDTRPCRHVTRSPMPPPLLAQSFRDRKSAYTALDCWSSNGARTPAQLRGRVRPSFAQQQAYHAQQPVAMRQQVAAPRAAPPLVDELSVWLQASLAHACLA